MSGNIQDTNVETLQLQIDQLMTEIDAIKSRGDSVADWESTLRKRYKHLSKTSDTLFKYIVTNYGTTRFDQDFFSNTIQMMLSKIAEIQSSRVTQQDASEKVGTHLATTFIPQLRK
jgi:hypothetical protein